MGVWLRRVGREKASQVPCRSKTPTTPSAPQPGRRLAAGRLRVTALLGSRRCTLLTTRSEFACQEIGVRVYRWC